MNKKIIIIILGCFLVLDLAFILFINLYEPVKKVDIKKFDEEYNSLKSLSKTFVEKRNSLYENEFNNVIITSVNNNYNIYINKLTEINNLISDIRNKTKYSSKICFENEVLVNDMITKCITYKDTYEKMNNMFFSDIETFNREIIDKYNDQSSTPLEHYSSEICKEYIDYNKDGKVEGKSANEEE